MQKNQQFSARPPFTSHTVRNIGIGLAAGAVILVLIGGPLPFGDMVALGLLGGAAATAH